VVLRFYLTDHALAQSDGPFELGRISRGWGREEGYKSRWLLSIFADATLASAFIA
jgi:hypothetical protein